MAAVPWIRGKHTHLKKTLRKINRLVKDIQRIPFEGMGQSEPLSGNLSGGWSRHIDEKNRIVFNFQMERQQLFRVKTITGLCDTDT